MPDDMEFVKAAAQGTVEGLTAPLSDILKRILGPAADELGQSLRDYVHFRRQRFHRLISRSKEIFEQTNTQPTPIPLKVLKPILEYGSIEENDDLQDRWAALLVNTPGNRDSLPAAAEILKQLGPFEVLLLQMCYDNLREKDGYYPEFSEKPVNDVIKKWYGVLVEQHNFMRPSLGHTHDLAVLLDNLKRLGLLNPKPLATSSHDRLDLTSLGFELIRRCQIPSARADVGRGGAEG